MMMMEQRSIDELYRSHRHGEDLTDPEWEKVNDVLLRTATDAVRAASARYKIPERTHDELSLAVRQRLLVSFLERRPKPTINLSAMLETMGFRAVISELRRIKGPMASQYDGVGEIKRQAREQHHDGDHYEMLRTRLPEPRFVEWGPARDIILAHLTMAGKLPDAKALRSVVPPQMLMAVYNTVIVEINVAMERLEAEEDE